MKKKVIAIVLAVVLVVGITATASASTGGKTLEVWYKNISIILDGQKIDLIDSNGKTGEPFIVDGTTYVPIRALAEILGLKVDWNRTEDGDKVILSTGSPFVLPEPVDKSTQPRLLITTDLEVDDQNGILLTLMFANEYDLAGIVATAGQFHFNGDGVHTLEEITPNYKCGATALPTGERVERPGLLKECRPVEPHILERLVDVSYRRDYEYLSQNDPNYPTPDYLLSITKEGNMEFEGDVRFATEGSDLIKQCILDDDPRTLYITHWGGSNTTVRALLDIYEEYYGTAQWDAILAKVVNKVVFMGMGEDNCVSDQGIMEKFPGLKTSGAPSSPFGFDTFFAAAPIGSFPIGVASEFLHPYYEGEYLTEAFKLNHGMLMGEFHLYGDGQVIYGEPYIYQYGLIDYMDWGKASIDGWTDPGLEYIFPRLQFNRYDWMCCQFTNNFITLGLNPDVANRGDNYTVVMFDELAARADWAIMPASQANHAPVVSADVKDYTVKAGETVNLKGSAVDPDGDKVSINWYVSTEASIYSGAENLTVTGSGETAQITIPADAASGDKIVVTMAVQDTSVERPMTRFVQFVITVDSDVNSVTANTHVAPTGQVIDNIVYYIDKPVTLTAEDFTITAGEAEAETVYPVDSINVTNTSVTINVTDLPASGFTVKCSNNDFYLNDSRLTVVNTRTVDDFEKSSITASNGIEMNYWLYAPESDKPLPLMVWLHGGGEDATNGAEGVQLTANRGVVAWVENVKEPTAVLSIQFPDNYSFGISEKPEEYEVLGILGETQADLIKQLIAKGIVDENRVYLSGSSSGGGCALEYARRYPDLFAAVLAICPKDVLVPITEKYGLAYNFGEDLSIPDEEYAKVRAAMIDVLAGTGMEKVPIYFAHADLDPVCTSYTSKIACEVLEEMGATGNVLKLYDYSWADFLAGKCTFPHAAWEAALEDQEIIDWVYSHVKD